MYMYDMYHDTVCRIRYTQDTSVPSGLNLLVLCYMTKKHGILQYWPCRSPTVCVCSGEYVWRDNDFIWHDMIHVACSLYIDIHCHIFTPLVLIPWLAGLEVRFWII